MTCESPEPPSSGRAGGGHGRPAPTDLPLVPEIRMRWSPRAFDPRPVEREWLRTLFEAARWAPSSWNEQPWRFLVATREEPEALWALAGYLSKGNGWARSAPVLALSACRTRFTRNDELNRTALRDLGAAEQNLVLQAFALGLVAHQMAGFDVERAREELLPDGFLPGSMIALGYPGDPESLPEKLKERELRERTRRELSELVFGGRWGEPAPFVRE